MPPKKQKKVVPKFPDAQSAFKYNTGFSYGKRDSPPMLNQIPVPIGANGCLKDINFVVTGTLPSLTREMAKDLIEKYGGRLTSSISGKTDVVIRGCEEVGPKKIQQAQSQGIQITDQEGLFEFIANTNPQYKKTTSSEPNQLPPPPKAQEPQEEQETPSKSKAKSKKKGVEKKDEDLEDESRIADILANLPKPTSSFEYIRGFHNGIHEDPPRHNQIPIPVGANQCLKGLVIVSTGTMPSLTNDELKDIIEKYGGTYKTSITKKTHLIIRGCVDVGESKMRQASSSNIPIIDQEGFFEIIKRSKETNDKPKQQKQEQTLPPPLTQNFEDYSTETYNSSLFSEKYRPRTLKDIVGNIGPINQLRSWIENFTGENNSSEQNQLGQSPSNTPKPIALVSGPAGIGKTTAVHLVCDKYGFSATEFNASDSRSKKFIESITATIDNFSFNRTGTSNSTTLKNAIIFEDIEDMSRSYSSLIEIAKKSKVPIICICNNSDDRKLEPLLDYSLPVRFSLPKDDEIMKRLRFICIQEGLNGFTDKNLTDIINISKRDVRFAINSIQYWGQWNDDTNKSVKDEEISDVLQAAITILTPSSKESLDRKLDGFFFDCDAVPLYVQQNLPVPVEFGQKPTKENRHNYADALESICYGDMMDTCIRENQTYALRNAQAITSSIYPSECVNAKVEALIMPKLFTASKKQQKFQRYINEIGQRTDTFSEQPKAEIYDTFSYLLNGEIDSITSKSDNHEEMLIFIDSLGLTPDDVEHVKELITFREKKNKKKETKFDSFMKDFMKVYRKKHSDDPKKFSSETDFRALHNIRQTGGKAKSIK